MKKLFAMLLALVMVLSLAACQPKEKTDGPIEIEFLHTHGETFGGPALEEIIKEFNETNGKGITVKTVLGGSYNETMATLQSSLAAGTEPALSTVAYSHLNYAGLNFNYVPIQDVIDKYFPEDKDYLANKYEQSILDLGTTVEGKLLGLPYGLSIPLMYYNVDLLKQAGLDTENLPTTWQEVRTYAEAVVEKTGKAGLYIQIVGDTYSVIPMFYMAGIDPIYEKDADGDGYRTNLATDGAVELWTFFQDMFKDGTAVYMTNAEGQAAMLAGDLAMYLTTSARINMFSDCGQNIVTYYHPKWEGSDLKVCLGGNMLTIWGQTEAKQKAAWEFIKFALKPENMAKFDNATGYVPPTKDVTAAEYALLDHPMMKDVIDEKSAARPWTSWPGSAGLQVDQYLVTARDKIYADKLDVKTVLQEVTDTINGLISED